MGWIFERREVAALLENFAIKRPLWLHEVSLWYLLLVLAFLKGAPFELSENASLDDLMPKTVFLMVLREMTQWIHRFSGLPAVEIFPDPLDWLTVVELPDFWPRSSFRLVPFPLLRFWP